MSEHQSDTAGSHSYSINFKDYYTFFTKGDPPVMPLTATQREVGKNDWVAGVFLLTMIYVIWLKFVHRKYFRHFIDMVLNFRHLELIIRENVSSLTTYLLCSTIISIILFSGFFYMTSEYFFVPSFIFPAKPGFAEVLVSAILFFSAKILFYWLSGMVLKESAIMRRYIFFFSQNNCVAALVLLLLVTGEALLNIIPGHFFPVAGFLVLIMIFFYRVVRTAGYAMTSTHFSGFYILLYLCTLEILPFFLVMKLFVGNVVNHV